MGGVKTYIKTFPDAIIDFFNVPGTIMHLLGYGKKGKEFEILKNFRAQPCDLKIPYRSWSFYFENIKLEINMAQPLAGYWALPMLRQHQTLQRWRLRSGQEAPAPVPAPAAPAAAAASSRLPWPSALPGPPSKKRRGEEAIRRKAHQEVFRLMADRGVAAPEDIQAGLGAPKLRPDLTRAQLLRVEELIYEFETGRGSGRRRRSGARRLRRH